MDPTDAIRAFISYANPTTYVISARKLVYAVTVIAHHRAALTERSAVRILRYRKLRRRRNVHVWTWRGAVHGSVGTRADAHALAAEVGAPDVKVQCDLYHCQIVEVDVATRLGHWLVGPHGNVGHIQIAGPPYRVERSIGDLALGRALFGTRIRRVMAMRAGGISGSVPEAQKGDGASVEVEVALAGDRHVHLLAGARIQ